MNKDEKIMILYNDEISFVSEDDIYDYEKVINKEDLSVSTIIENYDESILKELNQTPELCLAIVKENGFALEFVEEQTEEICLAAVKKYGTALRHVKEQTPEICLAAVKQDGFALRYVQNQTDEICMEAVKQSPEVLEYVKNQTYDICIEAVSNKPLLLECVKNQTEEICMEAVKRNINSVMKIKNPKTRNVVLTKLKPVFFYKSIKKYGQYIVNNLIDKYEEYDSLSVLNEEMLNIIKMNVDNMFNEYPDIEKIYYANCNDTITFDYDKIHKILVTYYNNRMDDIDKSVKIKEKNRKNAEHNNLLRYMLDTDI